jgi:hypothetical protein
VFSIPTWRPSYSTFPEYEDWNSSKVHEFVTGLFIFGLVDCLQSYVEMLPTTLIHKVCIFLENHSLTLSESNKKSISVTGRFNPFLAFARDIHLGHSSEYVRCWEYQLRNVFCYISEHNSLYVPPALTFNKSAFCPQNVIMGFVWFSE